MFSFLTLEHKKLPSWLICWKTDPGLNKISSILCALSLVTAMQISLLPHTSTGIVVLSSMILSTACLSWKEIKILYKILLYKQTTNKIIYKDHKKNSRIKPSNIKPKSKQLIERNWKFPIHQASIAYPSE